MKGCSGLARVKGLGIPRGALALFLIIGLGTVKSNTLIKSFDVRRDQKEALQIDCFLLIKHSDSNQALSGSKNDGDKGGRDWEAQLKIAKEYRTGLERDEDCMESRAEQEHSHESTELVSIKPNTLARLRLKLSRTPHPQTYSYLILLDHAEPRRQMTKQHAKKLEANLYDPFSNVINHSTHALLRFFGAAPFEHQRFSVRLSWDASDHVGLHLGLDHSPSSLPDIIAANHANLSFFNLTITPNFDKFTNDPSDQTNSCFDLSLIIEPLLLNALPMFTLLPLISTCVCILSVVYLAGLPSKFENFIRNFTV